MTKKTFIAIILARGGSKKVKNKNLVKIKNKPLIFWTIKDCLKSKKIKSTWVSSDSKKILKYSAKCGSNIIKRPKKYALDSSSSEAALLHAIKYLKSKNINFSDVVFLQATSPLRDKNDIDNSCNFYVSKNYDSLFSALQINDHFIWKKIGQKLSPNYNYKKRPRRQNVKTKYLENGSLYIFNKKKFLKSKIRLFEKIGVYLMKKKNSFQLDEPDDIELLNKII